MTIAEIREQPPASALSTLPSRQQNLSVAHVADFSRRYPGESLTFFTRVLVNRPIPGFRLRISLPPEILTQDYQTWTSDERGEGIPRLLPGDDVQYVIWDIDEPVAAGNRFDFRLATVIDRIDRDMMLESHAQVRVELDDGVRFVDEEVAIIKVPAKGNYLKFLPALYEEDELMGRFLMLFESFWAPIEQQYETIDAYFDPMLTPLNFLPWLGSWLNMMLDDRTSEAQRRELVKSASELYRKRGTRLGMEQYLKILTGEEPHIIEHRANNFEIGESAIMGPGIALGLDNKPHTFTVNLRMSPITSGSSKAENERLELERLNLIESIIETEKPGHTRFKLKVEIIGADDQD